VDLRHTDKEAQASNRVVGPVAIGFFEAAEALAAWCELCPRVRHFRPDRITGVETAPAAIVAGMDLAFAVPDADAVYVAWGSKDLSMLQTITDLDFGRVFVATDPDRRRLRMFTPGPA